MTQPRPNYEFGKAPIVPNTRPHFKCAACSKDVWREGGHASAIKHYKQEHPSAVVETYIVESLPPQAYVSQKRNFNNYGL
jgi:hypothetical protein